MNYRLSPSLREKIQVKDWMEHLRKNSWEMELLITGFVLVGLFKVHGLLVNLRYDFLSQIANSLSSNLISLMWRMLDTSVLVIIFDLILLLVLRGYWSGLVGLDSTPSVRPDAPVERNLTRNIWRMDSLCSMIFALSFLIVFVTITSGFFLMLWLVVVELANLSMPVPLLIPFRTVALTVLYLMALFAILKVFDFVSLGVLGRVRGRWFAAPYRLLSRIFGVITLGFLSGQIYRKLSQVIPRRRFQMLMLLYVVLTISVFLGLTIDKRWYFPNRVSRWIVNPDDYEDCSATKSSGTTQGKPYQRIAMTPTIQSELITEPFIRLYIPITVKDNAHIQSLMPAAKRLHGTVYSEYITLTGPSYTNEDEHNILAFYNGYYQITIDDTLRCDPEFLFYQYTDRQDSGILTYLPVNGLTDGLHMLKILRRDENKPYITPFWLMREK